MNLFNVYAMKKSLLMIAGLFLSVLSVAGQGLSMDRVNADFQRKKEALPTGDLFSVFRQQLTQEERDALTFFYAYMSVGDITDYSGNFYLDNVRSSLATRKETSWGKTIPDDIFSHFVLPVRINNENLDRARMVFHDELMPRVKGLSMLDAVLEVNHWCHEKVNYQPADARTSAPLATVKTAYGRCGEESTFLVAALRSVGIPARQVYTPRWAHTDDNHAWVEAWVDGEWHFLGACEPEPVLDLGWFNAPASRGMLMHTKVFGYYQGPEEVMRTTANYTEINIIGNYAKFAPLTVTVVDEQGKPVEGACVQYKIYNYSEFFTVHTVVTKQDGQASLSAGLGDMMVLATKGDRFGIQKVTFGKERNVTVDLRHRVGEEFSFPVDLVPPPVKPNIPEVTPEQRAKNDIRFNQEDSIRNAYVASFPDASAIEKFAEETGYNTQDITNYIVASRGNYADIMNFLRDASKKNYASRALQLLATLSEKDLRDTPEAILNDHLYNTALSADAAKVLAPRIAGEMLTAYRSFFQKEISKKDAKRFCADPNVLAEWCRKNLTLRDNLCCVGTFISPEGVWRSRTADRVSRDIFFVAVARSLGIPAWIDGVTGNVFYQKNGSDIQLDFESGVSGAAETGQLQLSYSAIPQLNDPEYLRHFTLSKYDGTGFTLLNYPDFAKWSALFKEASPLDEGYYMMVSGSRLADGGVLGQVSFFNIRKGEQTNGELLVRDNTEAVKVIGNFDSESKFIDAATGEETTVLKSAGRGLFVLAILGVGQEPTDHTLKDIAVKAKEFDACGRKMILLFPSHAAYEKYLTAPAPGLPEHIVWGIDTDSKIQKQLLEALSLEANTQLPIFIIGDTFNRIVFTSHGYTIGLGERLLKIIDSLNESETADK